MIGTDGRGAVAMLGERVSRLLILVPLTGRGALTVGEAVIAATGLPVYFAPHAPCERGGNENLTRIVRGFFPQGVTITSAPDYLATAASETNDRPGRIHNRKKPPDLFTELVETNASTR